jgi:hypothetical protein
LIEKLLKIGSPELNKSGAQLRKRKKGRGEGERSAQKRKRERNRERGESTYNCI